ncbi:hypothetical protein BDV11DRAFT_198485, partial [Aspergillus similis]
KLVSNELRAAICALLLAISISSTSSLSVLYGGRLSAISSPSPFDELKQNMDYYLNPLC